MADTFGNTTSPGSQPITPATPATPVVPVGSGIDSGSEDTGSHTSEAKSRFSAALAEAKAGATALGQEARERASSYRDQARNTGDTWSTDARSKAGELAVEGKAKVSEGLSGLSRVVSDNAATVDEKLGIKYGDYVRSASRSLQDGADRLNQKSLEELGEDARQFVRTSPGTAVGLAALTGYLFARLLRK